MENKLHQVEQYFDLLSKQNLCICTATPKRITFSNALPQKPGVYVIYRRDTELPIYVGEARNLAQRIRYLFRRQGSNPHPCHTQLKGKYCREEFAESFGVRYIPTSHLLGRLEIEEAMQKRFGTNKKKFYSDANL